MVGTNFMDETDCGSFFDHIDDLLDFPKDDLDTELVGASVDYESFPSFLPGGESDALFSADDSVFTGNGAPDLSAQLCIPSEDIAQLEWLSIFVEDSFSGGGMTMEKSNLSPNTSTKDTSQSQQFQTSSPVSVLESSGSCSTLPVSLEKRARSKRPRPPTFTPRPAIQLASPTSSLTEPIFIPCASPDFSTTSAESQPPKKKKIKIVPPSNPVDSNLNPNTNPNTSSNGSTPATVRKCMHCEITKTPQWRAGPMGPKTLCNACGVRYKSGRLFPEYRPAASPTFIPSVHSNSHKKVIEMRNKTSEESTTIPTPISI